MQLIRACSLAVLLALAALGAALPVHADNGVSVSVNARWGMPAPSTWIPYEVVVRNNGAADFEGDVVLAPAGAPYQQGYTPSDQFPHYSKHVTVVHQGQTKLEFVVFDAPFAYAAQVNDTSGRKVAEGTVAQASGSAAYTVGVLSDVPGAGSAIQGASSLPVAVIATRFNGASDFPKTALDLIGLQAIVIDSFDTASLSPAQLKAITDFVGFGGDLVIGAGASWRRTLMPLPPELVPLRPANTRDVSLQPLADLGGRTTPLTAAVAAGDLAGGTTALEGSDHLPLVVEGSYGSGRIVLLTYDPLADPIASNGPLSELAWAQGLARSVAGTSAVQPYPTKGGYVPPGAAVGAPGNAYVGPNGPVQSFADAFVNVLIQSPGATTPPLLLLGLVLLAYVALTGPVAYLVLRSMRRRELLWATAPVAAILFTIASYGIGFGSHGNDFVDNGIELQRVSPGGTIQTYSYQGLFAPQRGDHDITLPPATLATTSFGSGYGSGTRNSASDMVVVGSHTVVRLHGVAVWQPNSFQTVSLAAGSLGLEAHLSYSNNGVRGTIMNRASTPVRDLRLVLGSSLAEVKLAPVLQAGQSITVGPIPIAPASLGTPNAIQITGGGCSDPSTQTGREDCVLIYAAALGAYLPGQLELVGLVDAVVPLTVDGANPHHTTIAAMIEPVSLESIDSMVAGLGAARLVSVYRSSPNYLDAYDIDLPSVSPRAYLLKYGVPNPSAYPPGQLPTAPEVYNWSTGGWRLLATGGAINSTPLQAGEVLHGLARVRLTELSPGQSNQFLSVQEQA